MDKILFNSLKEKVLNDPEYNFLNKQGEIMLLGFGGSYAYGTNRETSDIDVRGVLSETPNRLLGMEDFEQFIDVPTDTVLYSFNKMVKLLIACNPNVIELLGFPEDEYLILSDEGKMLLQNRHLFLSKRCIHSFGGFAIAQLRRLKNALARASSVDEQEEHIYQSITHSLEHLHAHYAPFTDEELKIYLGEPTLEELNAEILIDVSLKNYPLRAFTGILSEMNSIIKNYNKVSHRNKKKDEPHLLKHSMHLIRLYLMCIDMLEQHEIITYREYDLPLFRDILGGRYSYEEIFSMADEYAKKLEEAQNKTTLPDLPDLIQINKFMVEINKNCLSKML